MGTILIAILCIVSFFAVLYVVPQFIWVMLSFLWGELFVSITLSVIITGLIYMNAGVFGLLVVDALAVLKMVVMGRFSDT